MSNQRTLNTTWIIGDQYETIIKSIQRHHQNAQHLLEIITRLHCIFRSTCNKLQINPNLTQTHHSSRCRRNLRSAWITGPSGCYRKNSNAKLMEIETALGRIRTSHTWTTYYRQLEALNNLSFPCKVIVDDADEIQLHGFCGTSKIPYGSYSPIHGTQCTLFCAKSRVAPFKVISLPRLEPCGVLLLAKLYESVIQATYIKIKKAIFFWTDTTIVLHWIHK